MKFFSNCFMRSCYSYMNNVKCIVQYKELRNITIVYAVRMCLVM